jgi:endo-1,4-beta-xylanase
MLRAGFALAWLLASLLLACCGGSREPLPGRGEASEQQSSQPESPAERYLSGISCRSDAAQDSAQADADPELPAALRETGALVGAAVSAWLLDQPVYCEIVAREFSYVTPENEMKWQSLEPEPGQFDVAAADRVVSFAEEHDMLVKGHTLVWHQQLPDWVEALGSEGEVREAMTQHIETVVAHFRDEFPGRVVAWDVVNEALNADGGNVKYRESVFYRYLREGYIVEAFEIAHRADPDALLLYNDYGIEGLGSKSTATLDLARGLLEAGVPIHGVGLQMHTRLDDYSPSQEDFQANLARYAELGLPVNISEMDVTLCDSFGGMAQRLQEQRLRYNRLAAACLESSQCTSITVWGVCDRYSWLNSRSPCSEAGIEPRPLAFDDDYDKKPAWWGLLDALLGCYY